MMMMCNILEIAKNKTIPILLGLSPVTDHLHTSSATWHHLDVIRLKAVCAIKKWDAHRAPGNYVRASGFAPFESCAHTQAACSAHHSTPYCFSSSPMGKVNVITESGTSTAEQDEDDNFIVVESQVPVPIQEQVRWNSNLIKQVVMRWPWLAFLSLSKKVLSFSLRYTHST